MLRASARVCAALALLLLGSLSVAPDLSAADVTPVRRILILNEVGPAYPVINLVDQGIREALKESPYRIEVYREYLETILFPDPADQQRFREFYIRKYRDRRPDVIITVGPAPLKFMQEVHQRVFPGVPIVFWLPLENTPAVAALDSDFTGVTNDIAPAETLDAALRLQPDAKRVIVLGGTSEFDKQLMDIIQDELKAFDGRLRISYFTAFTMPALLKRLKHLPSDTVVIAGSISQDAAGTRFIGAESSALVANAASVAVFSLTDANFNHGEVGGKLSNVLDNGKILGRTAIRMLNGERPQSIPRAKGATTYMFDWRAIKRWGLKEENVPAGSVVLNRQPTVWEEYKWYIITGISLIVVEALLISGLLWHRRRRRNAENQLAVTYDRLRMAVEAGRFVGWDVDIKAGTNKWFGDLPSMFGISSDSYSADGDEFRRRVHPEDLNLVLKAMDDARQNKKPYIAEFRIPREDGSVRWVLAKGKFYYDRNGEAQRMLGLAVDVTERKMAEEALSTLSGRLIRAQEQERMRIARELHDDINQRIALLAIEVDGLLQHQPDSGKRIQKMLGGLRERLIEISAEIQAISHRLHSSKLDYLGLAAACQSFCAELAERHEVCIQFEAEGIPHEVPQEVSICLFRVLQESLSNAIKHSGGRQFEVRLRGTQTEIQLSIRDHGIGFDVDSETNGHGLGLISMRERVGLVNGTMLVTSTPMGGTEISVRIPINMVDNAAEVTRVA